MDRADQFATSSKSLDIKHECYGFSADLIDYKLININAVRLISVRVITVLVVMC